MIEEIDRVCMWWFKKEDELDINIDFENFIKRDFSYKQNSSELYVLLHPWHKAPYGIYNRLRDKLLRIGYSCLIYNSEGTMLSLDYKLTKKCFRKMQKTVREDIHQLKKKHGFCKISLVGMSLSGGVACMVAKDNKDINKVHLVVPGHCLAEALWKGFRTKDMKEEFEKQGMTLQKLKKQWKEINPENNLSGLKKKEVFIYLSKGDKIIPYYSGKKLFHMMKEKGMNPHLRENRWVGHYLSVLNYCLFPKDIE